MEEVYNTEKSGYKVSLESEESVDYPLDSQMGIDDII